MTYSLAINKGLLNLRNFGLIIGIPYDYCINYYENNLIRFIDNKPDSQK